MALDRWIALIILLICLAYGYTAFFMMDDSLAPFMRRNPIWPSTFPKVLAILGIITSLLIVLGFEKSSELEKTKDEDDGEITLGRLHHYKWGQALFLLVFMLAYALLLRPFGFIGSTVLFLVASSMVLGERKVYILVPVALIAAGLIWYLVDVVLGIYLSPLPSFLGLGG